MSVNTNLYQTSGIYHDVFLYRIKTHVQTILYLYMVTFASTTVCSHEKGCKSYRRAPYSPYSPIFRLSLCCKFTINKQHNFKQQQ
jgi:hypothetical protein